MTLYAYFKNRIKARDTVITKAAYRVCKTLLTLDIRPIPFLHKALYCLVSCVSSAVMFVLRTLYWKPIFLSGLTNRPKRLQYEGTGLPFRAGPAAISMGDDCRLSARTAIIGRAASSVTPSLSIGNNVGIGWQTGIYIGTSIHIGDHVRIAEQCTLSGYAGHPLDAEARSQGLPDLDTQARDIVLEDHVWLGRGCIVNAGVTIGEGTVVAAGSVVTKDLPPFVLAAGVPAKVIRPLDKNPVSDAPNLEIVS